jgi:hypothetical protein
MPRPSIEEQIQQRVEAFTQELSQLVRQAALEAVEEAIRGEMAGGGAARPAARRAGAARASGGRGGRGGRRSAEDIAALQAQVLTHITANPGQRLEEISAGMAIPSKELKRPIANLLESGEVTKKGERRGTRYSPAGRRGARK